MLQFAAVVLMAGAVTLTACTTSPVDMHPGYGVIESVTQVDRDASRVGNTPAMSGVAGTLQGHPATGDISQAGSALGGTSGDALGGPLVASRSTNRNAYVTP